MGDRAFGVRMNPKAPLKNPAQYSVVGRSLPRPDLPGKFTGRHTYVHDFTLPGMLWARILRSPHAHAKIVAIDTGAAASMPGVAAIYTGADLVKDDVGTIPTLSIFKRPDGKPMTVPPRQKLASSANGNMAFAMSQRTYSRAMIFSTIPAMITRPFASANSLAGTSR